MLARLQGDEAHEGDHVFGAAGESAAEGGVLRGNADGTGVSVAFAHHHAAQTDEDRGGEAELLGAKEGADHHVAPRLDLSVHLQAHAVAQAIEQQRLLRLGKPQFPRRAGMADGTQRRSAGAAVVAADQDAVCTGFDDARRNGPHAKLRNQLDRHLGLRVDAPQVVDQLLDVLDRVDVVVWWRRDQCDPRRGMAHPRDGGIHLVSRQLTALARLGALGDLDLQFRGIDAILGRDAETAAGHLLDGAATVVAVGERTVTDGVFAALAAIAPRADAVHGDGDRLVRLGAERAEGHGARDKAAHDVFGGLHLLQRHGRGRPEGEQAAQRERDARAIVDLRRVLAEEIVAVLADRLLQQRDGLRAPEMTLAVATDLVEAAAGQQRCGVLTGCEGRLPAQTGLRRQRLQADAADARGGAVEVALDQIGSQSNGLEDLRPAVAAQRRDAHLRHDLAQALVQGADVVFDCLDHADAANLAVQRERRHVFEGEVGIDGRGAIAQQQRQVHHFARLGRLDQQPDRGAEAAKGQVAVDGRYRQQRRDRRTAVRKVAVAQNDERVACRDCRLRLQAQLLQRRCQGGATPTAWKADAERASPETGLR